MKPVTIKQIPSASTLLSVENIETESIKLVSLPVGISKRRSGTQEITNIKSVLLVVDIFFKLNVKYSFIICDQWDMYQLWNEWYPEANDFVGQNPYASLRSKVLQYAAWAKQYWVLWLHYKLVYKLVYGILYR